MNTAMGFKATITRRLEALEASLTEQNERKQMLLEAAEGDSEYVRLKERAKEASKTASLQKQALLNEPEYRGIVSAMKENAKEIKELRAMLTGELFAYTKSTDSFQMETADGQLHNIQYKAKLVKTNQPILI